MAQLLASLVVIHVVALSDQWHSSRMCSVHGPSAVMTLNRPEVFQNMRNADCLFALQTTPVRGYKMGPFWHLCTRAYTNLAMPLFLIHIASLTRVNEMDYVACVCRPAVSKNENLIQLDESVPSVRQQVFKEQLSDLYRQPFRTNAFRGGQPRQNHAAGIVTSPQQGRGAGAS